MTKFILHISRGNYTFTFHASTGELVATSPPFITRSSAQQALNETRVASERAHLYQRKESDNQFYFELYTENAKLLLVSEMYWSEESRDYAITLTKRYGNAAKYHEMV